MSSSFLGGDERQSNRRPLLAKQVLYQLSYVPAPSSLASDSDGS